METLDDEPADANWVSVHVRLVGAGVLAAVAGIVATILVAAGTVSVAPPALVGIATLAAVAAVAVPLGLALGVRYGSRRLEPTLLAGCLLGGFLFLRGQAFVIQDRPISYPLLFGVPGAAVALVGALAGAGLGSRRAVARRLAPSRLSPLARAGLVVAGGWTVVELLFGLGVAATVGALLDNALAGVLVATIVGFPVAALFAVRYGRRAGLDRPDWDYRFGRRAVGVGLVVGVLTLLAVQGVGLALAATDWSDTAVATFGFVLTDLESGPWVVALFALAHGVVAPLAEELAWRGVVQTALVRAQGAVVGVLGTALLFTAKHAVLDASLARVPTVLVLALVLGGVRYRWGTTTSTVVHVVVNTASVVLLAQTVGAL